MGDGVTLCVDSLARLALSMLLFVMVAATLYWVITWTVFKRDELEKEPKR